MTRKLISPNEASLAAAYYVPAYQRFRQWHRGQAIDLLCFVDKPNDQVKRLMEDFGAHASKEFRANCFAEIWHIPHEFLLNSRLIIEPSEFDKKISEALGCSNGRFSAAAGCMVWGDHREEEYHRKHVRSSLLEESRSIREKSPGQ